MKPSGAVELDGLPVVADVENVTVVVVAEESGGGAWALLSGAFARNCALLGDDGSEGAGGSGQKGDDDGKLHDRKCLEEQEYLMVIVVWAVVLISGEYWLMEERNAFTTERSWLYSDEGTALPRKILDSHE
jgi:hypothetical protein